MQSPLLAQLPSPPPGKTGWPWTEGSSPLPDAFGDAPWPRISVVTPSYNQGQFIEATIRSVLPQGYPNLEYLVIDGGSTDESVEIIRRYAPWLAYWVSEPDRGQTHAINKGFTRATGEVLAWLNSDDLYAPDAIGAVGAAYASHPGAVITGVVINFEDRLVNPVKTITPAEMTWERFLKFWEGYPHWHQPGVFFPRSAWEIVGPLDESFYYCMDRDYLVRVLQHAPVIYLNSLLAYFRVHATAKTVTMIPEYFYSEMSRVAEKHTHLLSADDLACFKHYMARFWVRRAGHHVLRGRPQHAKQCFANALYLNRGLALRSLAYYLVRLPWLLTKPRSGAV